MIDRLLGLLKGQEPPSAQDTQNELNLAVAALLVEAARMDQEFGSEERATILKLLEERFGLSAAEAQSLIEAADARVQESAQYFPFTHNINQAMTAEERIQVIEMLWSVAYADGTLDPYEDQLIRQIAGLIHVTDRDRMLARQRALAKAGS
jgi:uncharacterized tellurite resistance protein B-like protein